MADTRRSLNDLLTTLFQDGQAQGSLSPQDMRDLIVSIGKNPYAGCEMSGNSDATTIGEAGTYVKIAGTSTETNSRGFTVASNRLTYTGAPDVHLHIVANCSMTVAGNNKVIAVKIAKGGAVEGAPQRRKVAVGNDVGAIATHHDVLLSTNEYIEVFVTNETDTSAVTITDMYFWAMGMLK